MRLATLAFLATVVTWWTPNRAGADGLADCSRSDLGTNLLANRGFEMGAELPARWERRAVWYDDALFRWETRPPVRPGGGGGLRGLHSVGISTPVINDAAWVQGVEVMPDTTYCLSGWIRTQDVAHSHDQADPGANISVVQPQGYSEGLFGDNDWTWVSLSFDTGPRTEIQVAARIGGYAGNTTGTAWFDDLRLVEVPSCDQDDGDGLASSNLLEGPGCARSCGVPRGWVRRSDLSDGSVVEGETPDRDAPRGPVRRGRSCAKVPMPASGDAYWVHSVQVQPHTTYRLTGWIKTRDVGHTTSFMDAGANLSLLDKTVNGGFAHSEPLFGDNDWTWVSVTFDTGPEAEIEIVARVGIDSGTTTGTAWFDDIRLVDLTTRTFGDDDGSVSESGSD